MSSAVGVGLNVPDFTCQFLLFCFCRKIAGLSAIERNKTSKVDMAIVGGASVLGGWERLQEFPGRRKEMNERSCEVKWAYRSLIYHRPRRCVTTRTDPLRLEKSC
jgi:hypothetical protein